MAAVTTEGAQLARRARRGSRPADLGADRPGLGGMSGWLSLLLLIMMMLSVAWSVNSAGWTGGLGLLQWMVLGGALLGFALSHSRWSGVLPVLHSLVCSIAWILFWVGGLLGESFGPRDRVYQLVAGVALWVKRALGGAATAGSLIFVLGTCIAAWWVAYAAAWAVFRRGRVWRAILPAGLMMLLNLYYAPSSLTVYFLLFTFCALMLAVRSNLSERETSWRAAKVRYAMDIGLDFLRDGIIFAALVLALSFFLPSAASAGRLEALVRPLERPWERIKAEWNRLFSSLQYPSQPGYAAFGRSLSLSGPVNLTDAVIMDVQAPSGRYWRALVYQTYTGRGWINDDDDAVSLGAGEILRLPSFQLTRQITQTITTYYPGNGVLFATGQPLRAVSPAMAAVQYLPEDVVPTPTPPPGGGRPGRIAPPMDVSMVFARERLKEGDTYILVSTVTEADMQSLRSAGDGYPDWIRDRYLQLPDTLPQRVRDLAFEITASYDNAYDKAAALESYLRSALVYNDKIEAPPSGQDGVDYFLFDAREGYCDYYGSAMAVMARAVGIPARLAAGYSQGEFDQERGAYRVRELNAHAWVEVFFPGYGWVEFEPTANEPVIVRPISPPEGGTDSGPEGPLEPEEPEEDKFGPEPLFGEELAGGIGGGVPWWPLSLGWTIALGVGVLFVVAGGVILWLMRRPPSPVPHLLTLLYERLIHWGERLRLQWRPYQTVYEQASALSLAVPEGQPLIDNIAGLYVRERFGPTPAGAEDLQSAAMAWSDLRPLLWRQWLRRLARPPERLVQWRDHWSRRLASQFPG